MSVDIYGVEEYSNSFETIGVSSERTFHMFWEKAINDLKLHLIGNMVWLYKKDLSDILLEFQCVKKYMEEDRLISEDDRRGIIWHIDNILENLEGNWNKVPEAERLWMG